MLLILGFAGTGLTAIGIPVLSIEQPEALVALTIMVCPFVNVAVLNVLAAEFCAIEPLIKKAYVDAKVELAVKVILSP